MTRRRLYRYFLSVLISLDQFGNALLGGYADETLSYRAARARRQGRRWGCLLCRLLDAVHRRHCDRTVINKRASILMRHPEWARPRGES